MHRPLLNISPLGRPHAAALSAQSCSLCERTCRVANAASAGAGLRKKHLLMHGSLYLFSNHMGFHSTLPFGYTKNRLIAFKARNSDQRQQDRTAVLEQG